MPEDFVKPFLARCPGCIKPVTVQPLFTRSQAERALSCGSDLEVMHTADRDHRWVLDEQERENLRRALAAGEL